MLKLAHKKRVRQQQRIAEKREAKWRERALEARQRELMEQDRVDEVIKEWLRERNRRALRRDKKVRDMLRADRRFLSTLQVSKEAKVNDGGAGAGSAGQLSGQGWTPNVVRCHDVMRRCASLCEQLLAGKLPSTGASRCDWVCSNEGKH